MLHNHLLVEDDHYFVVDAETRDISGGVLTLMQYDHNSEIVTFEIPKVIEGHEMLDCDKVEVHYVNTGSGTSSSNRKSNPDVYRITDLKVNPDDPETLIGTWLISQNATMFAGTTKFLLKFMCEDSNGVPTYIWHTNAYSGIEVLAGFDNTQSLLEIRPDIFAQYDQRMAGISLEVSEHSDILEDHDAVIDDLSDVGFKSGGSKAFTILNMNSETKILHLDSIAGLEVGDTYSARIQWWEYDYQYMYSSEHENIGKITDINRRASRMIFSVTPNSHCLIRFDPNDPSTYSGECECSGDDHVYATYTINVDNFDDVYDVYVTVKGEYQIYDTSDVEYFETTLIAIPCTPDAMDNMEHGYSGVSEPAYTIEYTVTVDALPQPPKEYSEFQISDSYIDDNGVDNELNTFRIMTKPDVGTRTIGKSAIVAGINNKALSRGAVSFGEDNISYGSYSFTEGLGNEAHSSAQHVAGKYNALDPEGKYAYILGNGASDTERSNAHTIDWEGNAWFAGDVMSGDKKLATEEFVLLNAGESGGLRLTNGSGENAIVQGGLDDPERASAKNSAAFGIGTKASSTEGQFIVGTYNPLEGLEEVMFAVGVGSDDDNRLWGFVVDIFGSSYTFGTAFARNDDGEMAELAFQASVDSINLKILGIQDTIKNIQTNISTEKVIEWSTMNISGTDGSIGTISEAGVYEMYADAYFATDGSVTNIKVNFGTIVVTSVSDADCYSAYGAIKVTGSDAIDGAYVNVFDGTVFIKCDDGNGTISNLGAKVSPNTGDVSKLYYRKIRSA